MNKGADLSATNSLMWKFVFDANDRYWQPGSFISQSRLFMEKDYICLYISADVCCHVFYSPYIRAQSWALLEQNFWQKILAVLATATAFKTGNNIEAFIVKEANVCNANNIPMLKVWKTAWWMMNATDRHRC